MPTEQDGSADGADRDGQAQYRPPEYGSEQFPGVVEYGQPGYAHPPGDSQAFGPQNDAPQSYPPPNYPPPNYPPPNYPPPSYPPQSYPPPNYPPPNYPPQSYPPQSYAPPNYPPPNYPPPNYPPQPLPSGEQYAQHYTQPTDEQFTPPYGQRYVEPYGIAPAVGYQQQPGFPGAAPSISARRRSRAPLWFTLAAVLVVLAVGAVLAFLSPGFLVRTTFDDTAVATTIQEQSKGHGNYVHVTCPSGERVTKGTTFTCTAEGGREITVRVTSSSGDYTWEPAA